MSFYETIESFIPERIPAIGAIFYSAIPARRFRKYYRIIADSIPVEEGRILDIGTGPGYLPIEIAKKYPSTEAVGIDISERMIEIAEKNSRDIANVDFVVMDANKLEFDDNYFDFIVSSGSSHHWRNPVRIYNEIYRVLKKGRQAWIYELCPNASKEEVKEVLFAPYPLFKFVASLHGIGEAEYQTRIKDIIEASRFLHYTFEKQAVATKVVLRK
jgi:ubiquinone/menaquinone biosynthesis C-methylase UbiE